MKYTLLGLVTALLLGSAAPALAQDAPLRIGYVNSDRVLRDATPAKAADAKLEAEFGRRRKELADSEARLRTLAEKFEKDRVTLNEAERTRREREVLDLDRDLQRKRRELQEDFGQRRNEEIAALVERANRAIRQVSEQEKYDLILQDVVYANPRIDITDKVIRILNTSGK